MSISAASKLIVKVRDFGNLVGDSCYGWKLLLGRNVKRAERGHGRVNSWNPENLEIGVLYENSYGSRFVRYERSAFLQEFTAIDPPLSLEEIFASFQIEEEQERCRLKQQEIAREIEKNNQEVARKAEERKAYRLALLQQLREHFERDFLNSYQFYEENCTQFITHQEYQNEKVAYVRSWFKSYLNIEPDYQQATAIASVDNHVQVVARAGSGKTLTLVNRALFLQKHCGVAPNEMLLLAFNRDAVKEIKKRLTQRLGDSVPHIMTFHSLAHRLVQLKGRILYDAPEGEQSKSRVTQENVIVSFVQDPKYYEQIRTFMMARFRQDWEQLESYVSGKAPQHLLQYRRSLTAEAIDGTFVKSFGEKVIANFLFEHGIEYRYEASHRWNGQNYRPDFTLKQHKIVIEYFGLEGDPDYDELSKQKREYWRTQHKYQLIEFSPKILRQQGAEVFCTHIKQSLEKHGVKCDRLSEEEIWKSIKVSPITRFTKVVVQFIQRCRKLSLTPEQLSEKIQSHQNIDETEKQFLALAQLFYESYLNRLKETGDQDFDGLLQDAAQLVELGTTTFHYQSDTFDLKQLRYIFIDEYQDFSKLFHQLTTAIQIQNPHACFFCVGDDWQAINGFAGSDLNFYREFGTHFKPSTRLDITTNYRSLPVIVHASNELMRGLGTSAQAYRRELGKIEIANLESFQPTPEEQEKHGGDSFTPAVLRLVKKALQAKKEVALLSRKNTLPWWVNYEKGLYPSRKKPLDRFLNLIHSHLPESHRKAVTISTAHGFKGLEKEVIIILDAIPRRYPLLHPDLKFTRVLGDSVEQTVAEERRLFYVALTRAIEQVIILTEKTNSSPFLEDIEQSKIPLLSWTDYLPNEIVVRVGNQSGRGSNPTVNIKPQLKAEGYTWQTNFWAGWYRTYVMKDFSVKHFFDQAQWSKCADGIEVRFYDASDKLLAIYQVNSGCPACVFDKINSSIPF